MFLRIFLCSTVLNFYLDVGAIATSSIFFPYAVAAACGLASACVTCLFVHGMIGFAIYQDGTTQSLCIVHGSWLVAFLLTFAITTCTFKSLLDSNTALVSLLFGYIFLLAVYVFMQLALAIKYAASGGFWTLGNVVFGAGSFLLGQCVLYSWSSDICHGTRHYADGLVFSSMCNLVSVMMVYKYWNTMVQDDFEFSIYLK